MFSTQESEASKDWVEHLPDRDVKPGKVYAFCDGSSSGWHGAVIVRPGFCFVRYQRFREPTSIKNVGAELNGMLLALAKTPIGSVLVLVFDYNGIGAWLSGNWGLNDDEVYEKIQRAHHLIEERELKVTLVHHGGHQKDPSHFTFFNNEADYLCKPGAPPTFLGLNEWPPAGLPPPLIPA